MADLGALAVLATAGLLAVGACEGGGTCPAPDAGPALDGGPDRAAPSPLDLLGAPMVSAPTAHGFGLDTVLRSGDPARLRARVRAQPDAAWVDAGLPTVLTPDLARWAVEGLLPGRRYEYQIQAAPDGEAEPRTLYAGSAVTRRPAGAAYTFAVLADTHIEPRDVLPPGQTVIDDTWGYQESTLRTVAHDIGAGQPDFVINVGDILDYHIFGFNDPPPDAAWARLGYLNYRRMMGDLLGQTAHFPVLGNWDGENGCNSAEEIRRAMSQRTLYAPGPSPTTYPEGGSVNEDYYAFTWGDALFVVLNVMTYTPTCHLLSGFPGLADDWTLGPDQLAWLDRTLAGATSRWRFLFIHHTVGGAAGNPDDTAYGRGGGQAAHVGEQAVVHAMMQKYGVQIFFYAHDHVFTDMVVDGIHYTLPGSAGAPWKFDATETGYAQSWPDSGYGRVQVSPQRVQVDFVAAGGQVLTSYTVN